MDLNSPLIQFTNHCKIDNRKRNQNREPKCSKINSYSCFEKNGNCDNFVDRNKIVYLISRRSFLKTTFLSGLGGYIFNFSPWKIERKQFSFFLVTDNPPRDIQHFLKCIPHYSIDKPGIKISSINPSDQDIGIIKNGRLLDPVRFNQLPKNMYDLAFTFRSRKTQGHFLVSIEEYQMKVKNLITFECNGQVIDKISRKKDYEKIEIRGERGKTIFKYQNGNLSVVETSCRNELCKKIGGIQSGRIICAPNKLVATVSHYNTLVDGISS